MMALQAAPWHTPEEMRQIVNAAHVIEGVVLGAAAFVMVAESMAWFRQARFIWPTIVAGAGVMLWLYMLIPHHGLNQATAQWTFVFGDAQQRQHLLIASLMATGGWAELQSRRGRLAARSWAFAWPAALIVIGVLFFVHTQHGTGEAVAAALSEHRQIGAAFVLTGVLGAAAAYRARAAKWLGLATALALAGTSALLVTYREPPGAYETHGHN